MKIGLYGGTFDPIHSAHLIISQYIKEELNLDKVIFIPAGIPPHKEEFAPAALRLEMVKTAISEHDSFEVSEIELKREGPSYSVETIRMLKDAYELSPNDLYWLVGSDAFYDMPKWRDPQEILAMCSPVVFPRETGEFHTAKESLREDAIYMKGAPTIEISSTRIREFVRAGRSIKHWVPPAVERIIKEHQLYL